MNLIKLKWNLWKHYLQEKKKVSIEKHSTKTFYVALDLAIEKCKQKPRKYYIVKANHSDWEILGSQELRRMRKFSEAKADQNFMHLHELAPFVSPENLKRHIHEQKRRKWYMKFVNRFTENYYVPVTKGELEMLKQVEVSLLQGTKDNKDNLSLFSAFFVFIQKHS